MEHAGQTNTTTNERWLPMVSEVAQAHGWLLSGERLERLVDQVAGFLADDGVAKPSIAATIIANYYHDSAAVALLQAEWGEVSSTLWEAVMEAARKTQSKGGIAQGTWPEAQNRITRRLKKELQRHNYQSSLRLVIARIVIEELAATMRA